MYLICQKRILLEIWKEDFKEIEAELKQAAEQGVIVTIIAYGDIVSDFANVYLHDMSSEITEEYDGRWLVYSGDDSEVVAGIVSLGNDSRAAWTMHVGLVMPITEVIIHDLYLMEILKKHRELLEESFGKNLIQLRRKFSIHSDFKNIIWNNVCHLLPQKQGLYKTSLVFLCINPMLIYFSLLKNVILRKLFFSLPRLS